MVKRNVAVTVVTGMASALFALLLAVVTFWSGHTQVRDFGYQTTYWLIVTAMVFLFFTLLQKVKN